MTKVIKDTIKDNEMYLLFDRSVDSFSMEIITTSEPISSFEAATQFRNETQAQAAINELEKGGYDTTNCVIEDYDTLKKEKEDRIEKQSEEFIKAAWANTSDKKKKEMLEDLKKNKGQEAVDDFLKRVETKENSNE